MLSIDKLHIDMHVKGSEVVVGSHYALIGNLKIEIKKYLEAFVSSVDFQDSDSYNDEERARKEKIYKEEERIYEEEKEHYYKYIIEAKATQMYEILSWIKERQISSPNVEKIKNSMKEINELAYMKAEKLFWESEFDKKYTTHLEEEKLI